MQPKPTTRLPILVLFLIGIFVLLAVASASALSAPPEPEPERSYYQAMLLDPQRKLDAPGTNRPAVPAAPQAPGAGEGISLATYQHLTNDNWDILIRDGTTGPEIPIANSGYDEIQPRIRRGADRVAYISDMQDGFQLWTMNPDNTDKRRLTSGAESSYPNWSPDGTRIVFEREVAQDEVEVFVINADGSGLTQLTFSPGYDGMASWAPDGSHILFISTRSGGYRIWRMNPDGSNLLQLNDIPYSMDPYYSPDGQQITFDSYHGTEFAQIWLLNADGSNPQMIHQVPYADCMVTGWSPDGKNILFTEIQWVMYNGQWYWTSAYVKGLMYRIGYVNQVENYSQSGIDLYMSWQSVDILAPQLSLAPLRAESGSPLQLRVTGSDSGGSGLSSYAIQYRQAGGDWQELAALTPIAEAPPEFSGTGGVRYEFRVRGVDNASNFEPWPATPDAATRIESLPPRTAFINPPRYHSAGVMLPYQAFDLGGSRIAGYDSQRFDEDTQAWVMIAENTLDTEVYAWNAPGYSLKVRVRARDTAGNVEAWPEAGDPGYHEVTFYSSSIYGIARANTGAPVSGVEVSSPGNTLVAHQNSDPSGAYISYFTDEYPNATFSKPGYGSLPQKAIDTPGDHWFEVYLPPADNLVQDGDLEQNLAEPGSPWTLSGNYPFGSPLDPGECHTGTCAALSSVRMAYTDEVVIFPLELRAYQLVSRVGEDDSIHFIAQTETDLVYRKRTAQGDWLPYESIHTTTPDYIYGKSFAVDTEGVVHLVYIHSEQIYYIQRNLAGVWSSPRHISGSTPAWMDTLDDDFLQIDSQGGVHILWLCNWTDASSDLCHAYRPPQGSWGAPEWVDHNLTRYEYTEYQVATNGVIHAAWSKGDIYTIKIRAASRATDGTWSAPQELGDLNNPDVRFAFGLDANQRPMVAWYRGGEGDRNYIQQRWMQSNGNWSAVQESFLEVFWGSPIFLKMAYDGQARLHLVYSYDYHYAILPRSGEIDRRGAIHPDIYKIGFFKVTEDGRVHLVYNQYSASSSLYSVLENGDIIETITMEDALNSNTPSTIFFDSNKIPHFIYSTTEYDQGYSVEVLHHVTYARVATTAEIGEISQTVTIPAAMNQAGLSFLYWLGGGQEQSSSALSAWVDAGSGAQEVIHIRSRSKTWEHAWVDLSAYARQTVTLSLRMDQAAGEVRTYGYLDEVSLGSGYGDSWLKVEPADRNAPPGETFELAIDYGNQGGFALPGAVIEVNLPLGLELLDSSQPCAGGPPVLSCALGELAAGAQGTLTLSLRTTPAVPFNQHLDLGLHLATTGTELELLNNQMTVGIVPVNALYLPSIGNWWAGD